jgi:hypothetical protein
MNKRGNRLYMNRFLSSFRGKIRAKMQVMPEAIHDRGYETIRTLEDYDARYTVPHFGFDSVPAFYRHVSSRHVAAAVRIPTLVVNALDDPLMGPSCHPREAAATNPHLHPGNARPRRPPRFPARARPRPQLDGGAGAGLPGTTSASRRVSSRDATAG